MKPLHNRAVMLAKASIHGRSRLHARFTAADVDAGLRQHDFRLEGTSHAR